MGAREKLNASYFTGSLIVAALLGLVTESWPVFFLALAVLLASNLYLREIRLRQGRGRHRKGTSRKGE